MESLNQYLAAIDSSCLKWRMTLSTKKIMSVVVSQSLTNALCYDDLTLGDAEFIGGKESAYSWSNLRL